MTNQTTPAGAMPVVASATLAQSYPFGPGFAAYRLPCPGLNGIVSPREIGIGFEGEAGDAGSAGATRAGSGQAAGGDAGAAGTAAATGSASTSDADAALGEAGKGALEKERTARRDAEKARQAAVDELERLKAATLSDAEKAIAEAKKAGAAEVSAKLSTRIRSSEVRAALIGAGAASSLLDLAIRADEFAALEVTDDGAIEGLDEALAAFRKGHPDVFTKAGATPGSGDTGTGGGRAGGKPTYTREQLRDVAFFAANRADILAAQKEGRITN